jgi:hypothetical protein
MARVKPRVAIVAASLVALAAAAGVFARTQTPPDPLQQATADGCERNDTTLHTLQSPNWVYVDDKDYPAAGPAPSLETVSGVVRRDPLGVHTSGGDNPVSHAAYDLNFDVAVDAADSDLVARTNTSGGLHVEREEAAVPTYVWPEPGDRVTLRGAWVWDCDHFTSGSDEVTGEETELHPWTALWVERAQSARSRTGEREIDLYVSSDKTEAGKSADCAHRAKHSQATFKACVLQEPKYADVSGRYEFTLPVSGRVRVVDRGSRYAPPLKISGRKVTFVAPVDRRLPDRRRLVVAKQIFVQPKRTAPALDHLRVTFDSVLIRRAMDPACIPSAPAGCGTPETTRDDQVSHGPTGEWNFYTDVAGVWSAWQPRVWRVRDGQTIHPGKPVDVWVPRFAPWRLLVWARECDWGTLARGGSGALVPCPKQAEAGNRGGDDVPGAALKRFRSVAASLGTHTLNASNAGSTCPAVNRNGCYSVTFTVRRLAR